MGAERVKADGAIVFDEAAGALLIDGVYPLTAVSCWDEGDAPCAFASLKME